MTARGALVRELFLAALDRAPEVREQWLAAHCGGDLDLQQELEALLGAAPPAEFLAPPTLGGLLTPAAPSQFGPYRVEARLEADADRWLARHPHTQRLVRIEVHPAPATPDALGQFVRLAHAPERLGTAGCVRVHEHGACAQGVWVAMDHVDGHSLAREQALQQQRAGQDGCLLPAAGSAAWTAALGALFGQLATLLAAAHAIGLAHGSLALDRVLLEGVPPAHPGRAFLCGFGTAVLAGRSPTPGADIAALGAMLRELLATGASAADDPQGTTLRRLAERAAAADRRGGMTMAALATELGRACQGAPPRPGFTAAVRRWFARE